MFEYAKEEINKKIRDIESQISLQKEEELDCEKSREHILSYLNAKKGIESFIRSTIFGSILGAVLIFLGCKYASIFSLLGGIACFPVVVKEIVKIVDNKKLLKNNYSDISSLEIDELFSELNTLSKKEFNASSERRELERKKNHYNIELEKIRRYKDIIEEVVNEISKDPYYSADTEEEYKMLVLVRDEKLKMLDDYLNENIDYSSIHFDYGIKEDKVQKMVKTR